MINAAATFRTFGHLIKATIVRRFPKMPTIIIRIVSTAATVNNGLENLERGKKAPKITQRFLDKDYFPNENIPLTMTINH